ncbi:hypothetical protein FQN54_000560 [Arachnomyces sp. PD_36]|nr:hypothetical protein FQN54_000560 [Arachnomyces sp. PD_36]
MAFSFATTPLTIDFTDFQLLEEDTSFHKADDKTHTIVDWLERTIPSYSYQTPTLTNTQDDDDSQLSQPWDPDFDRFVEQSRYIETQFPQETSSPSVNLSPPNLRLDIPTDSQTPSTTIGSSSPQQSASEGQGFPSPKERSVHASASVDVSHFIHFLPCRVRAGIPAPDLRLTSTDAQVSSVNGKGVNIPGDFREERILYGM